MTLKSARNFTYNFFLLLSVLLGVIWAPTEALENFQSPSLCREKEKTEKILILAPEMNCGGTEQALVNMLRILPLTPSDYDVCIEKRGGGLENALPKTASIVSIEQAREIQYSTVVVYAPWIKESIWRSIPTKRRIHFLHADLMHFPTKYPLNLDKNIDRFVGVSDVVTKSFCTVNPMYAKEIRTIKTCIDVSAIKKGYLEPQNEIVPSSSRVTVITVARLSQEKGIDRALRVHKRLNDEGIDFRWYIIGEGEMRQVLEQQTVAAGLQGKFILLGWRKNPHAFVKAADILVCSSYTESGPMVINEALCVGCPVLSTRVGYAAEYVKSGVNGFVVENSDEALYACLKMLLKNRELVRSLRESAKKFEYNNSLIVRELMDTFFPQEKGCVGKQDQVTSRN